MSARTKALRALWEWGHHAGAQHSPFASWVRLKGCQLRHADHSHKRAHACAGPVELDHWDTRGAGTATFRRTWGLCRQHHADKGGLGKKTFARVYQVDPPAIMERQFQAWAGSAAGQAHLRYVRAKLEELA